MLAEGHCEWNWFPMSRQVYISNWYAQQNHLCLDLQGRTDCDCELTSSTTLSVWNFMWKFVGNSRNPLLNWSNTACFLPRPLTQKTPEVVGNPINTTSPNSNAGAAQWASPGETITLVERLALLEDKCACLLFRHAEPLRCTAILVFWSLLYFTVWDWY